MKRQVMLLIAFMTIISGCEMSIFNTEPFVDTKRDEQGNVVIKDTPRNWQDFKLMTQVLIKSEAEGQPPPGVDSWNKFWLIRINYKQNGSRENPQKYVNYIIESRRAAGLPELEGYPADAKAD